MRNISVTVSCEVGFRQFFGLVLDANIEDVVVYCNVVVTMHAPCMHHACTMMYVHGDCSRQALFTVQFENFVRTFVVIRNISTPHTILKSKRGATENLPHFLCGVVCGVRFSKSPKRKKTPTLFIFAIYVNLEKQLETEIIQKCSFFGF
jgi:hypothetical protein